MGPGPRSQPEVALSIPTHSSPKPRWPRPYWLHAALIQDCLSEIGSISPTRLGWTCLQLNVRLRLLIALGKWPWCIRSPVESLHGGQWWGMAFETPFLPLRLEAFWWRSLEYWPSLFFLIEVGQLRLDDSYTFLSAIYEIWYSVLTPPLSKMP